MDVSDNKNLKSINLSYLESTNTKIEVIKHFCNITITFVQAEIQVHVHVSSCSLHQRIP